MSAVAPSTIRQRAAAAIAALDGWTESTRPESKFGLDSSDLMDRGFAVGVPTTVVAETTRKRALGVYARTTVSVRWSYLMRADDQVGSNDEALDAELLLVGAVTGMTRTGLSSINFDRAQRTTDEDTDHVFGVLEFTVTHRLQLDSTPE